MPIIFKNIVVLWPALRLGHRATPSTVCLHLLYPHLLLASFVMLLWPLRSWSLFSLSFPPVCDPPRWSYCVCVHDLSSLSHSPSFLSRLYIAESCVVIVSGVWFCGYTQCRDGTGQVFLWPVTVPVESARPLPDRTGHLPLPVPSLIHSDRRIV